MKMSKRRLRWPQDVPVATRIKLKDKAQVCGFRHLSSGADEEAFDGQRVRLERHLFVLVRRGNLLVERPEGGRWIKEGDAAFVLPGQIVLTESPDLPEGGIDIEYVLFSTRFIRNFCLGYPFIEIQAHKVYPAYSDIYILNNFVPRVQPYLQSAKPEEAFSAAFNYAVCGGFALPYMFLKDSFYTKKRALDLSLQKHIADPAGETSAAAEYPGGAQALYRDCLIFTGLSPKKWLTKRRMELAHVWLRHGDRPVDDIAAALGYRVRSRFRDDYRKANGRDYEDEYRRHDLLQMSQREFLSVVTPFWHPSEEGYSPFMMSSLEGSRMMMHPEQFARHRRRKAPMSAIDGGPVAGTEVDAAKADEIPAPANPGFTVVKLASQEDKENPENRMRFAELKTAGMEFINFPKHVIDEHMNPELEACAA